MQQIHKSNLEKQLLYFTSPSVAEDRSLLFFIGEKEGCPNVYSYDFSTGQEKKLTTNSAGILKSYVYFWGDEKKGLGKASISLDCRRKKIYYIQDNNIFTADEKGNVKKLNMIPEGQVTAFTHVSRDGRFLCVPTTDKRALEFTEEEIKSQKILYDIDERVRVENLCSYIHIYDTETGEEHRCEKVEKAWITHVQFSPVDSNLILYNHEYCSDSGIRRMWLWNGKSHIPLRDEGEGRNRQDWTCHEMWQPDGNYIIYHGRYTSGISYVGRVSVDLSDRQEISLPQEYQQYGHFTVAGRHNNWLVSDGYYRQDLKDNFWAGRFISLIQIRWEEKHAKWYPLCLHGSDWSSQDCHPHPIFDGKDEGICFTSNESGKRRIYYISVSGKDIKKIIV